MVQFVCAMDFARVVLMCADWLVGFVCVLEVALI